MGQEEQSMYLFLNFKSDGRVFSIKGERLSPLPWTILPFQALKDQQPLQLEHHTHSWVNHVNSQKPNGDSTDPPNIPKQIPPLDISCLNYWVAAALSYPH